MNDISTVKKSFIDYTNRIVINDKVSHCYLIEIDDYENDFIYIQSFMKMILFHTTNDQLNNCDSNINYLIDNNDYPDIMVIEPDGHWIKKSQLLALQKEYSNKSLIGTKRFYIIKHAECLNSSSANTMLKFLEEPEENIFAILVTDNRYHVMDTILSRCQILSLKENSFSFFLDDSVLSILNCIIDPNYFFIHYNSYVSDIFKDKNNLSLYFENIEKIIISFFNSKYINDSIIQIDSRVSDLFSKVTDERLLFILNNIEDELTKLYYNINFKLWLDSFFSKLVIGGMN